MSIAKRTYALPDVDVARFEKSVPTGRRSAVIASLIRAWLDQKELAAVRADLETGCRDMWDVYAETSRDWEAADDALLRSVDQ